MVSSSTRFLAALVVAAWAFAFAPGASASFHVEKANFNVRMPASIKGTYEMSIANFGTPLYGATLACVLPRRRASFPRDGRRARAPTRARFGRPGATISFSSRDRAPRSSVSPP